MVIDERESRHDYIVDAARQIMTAGRTAPKGKGIDNIEIVALTQNSILEVAGALRVSAEETGLKFFLRDADNIELAEAIILVGSRTSPMGLNCGYCGYATCIAKGGNADAPCALNSVDLGIALGSMAATAAELHIDNRIMFSAGYAARKLGLLPGCRSVFALPLSISSKNPFFDRQTNK